MDSAGSIASENRKIYCELRRGRIDGPLASRLSAILIGQKGIVESSGTEAKIALIEERITELQNKGGANIVKFKRRDRSRPNVEQVHFAAGTFRAIHKFCKRAFPEFK